MVKKRLYAFTARAAGGPQLIQPVSMDIISLCASALLQPLLSAFRPRSGAVRHAHVRMLPAKIYSYPRSSMVPIRRYRAELLLPEGRCRVATRQPLGVNGIKFRPRFSEKRTIC